MQELLIRLKRKKREKNCYQRSSPKTEAQFNKGTQLKPRSAENWDMIDADPLEMSVLIPFRASAPFVLNVKRDFESGPVLNVSRCLRNLHSSVTPHFKGR